MSTGNSIQSCRSNSQPLWLQAILADLDEKMKTLAVSLPDDEDSDSFAERAENYYQKRPQLLDLLKELYNGYLTLADRYCQALIKNNPSQIPAVHSYIDDNEDTQIDSDAESSLSYQPTPGQIPNDTSPDSEILIAELVAKTVHCEILFHELGILEKNQAESTRKIELQKSLLEVLESERMILLNENARLGYQVTALVEENKALASESMFMKRKASEMARCVLKMRDDHRVCLLSRKIEDLQGQIYGLEKRNKEYYEQLVMRRKEGEKKDMGSLGACLELEAEKIKIENEKRNVEDYRTTPRSHGSWRIPRWWERFKKFDLFLCVPDPRSTSC